MTREETIDALSTKYSLANIPQFATEKNTAFLKDLFELVLNYFPISWEGYFKFQTATGDHLTEIAFTLFGLSRTFDDITLTDDELQKLCSFALSKKTLKKVSVNEITEIFQNIFNGEILVKCEPAVITYFASKSFATSNIYKALIKFDCFIRPINATLKLIAVEDGKKYLYFPSKNNPFYNAKQGTFQSKSNPTEDVIFLDKNDITIIT